MRIILATHNRHKAEEIARILEGLPVELSTAADVQGARAPEETGDSLETNALLKARVLREATGLAALADDTGLFVEALEGRPGVRSARYAGPACRDEDNVRRLLEEMREVPPGSRQAFFKTVVALDLPGERPFCLSGEVQGWILEAPRGGEGFGYDPVFRPEGWDRSFAEATQDEKNAVSHRGRAFRKVREWLEHRLTAAESGEKN